MTKASYTVISFWYQPLGKRERKCICRISEEWRKSLIKGRMCVRESICLTSLQNCYSMKCLIAEQVSTNTLLKHSWVLKHYSLLWARGKHVWHERNVSRKETTTFTHSSPDSSCWEIWYLWTIIWAALAKCRLDFSPVIFAQGSLTHLELLSPSDLKWSEPHVRILNEKPFWCIAPYVNLDSGNKGAQVDPKTPMIIGTKIVIQRVTGLKVRSYWVG